NVPFAYQIYEASTEGEDESGTSIKGKKKSTSTSSVSKVVKKSSRPENVDPADFKRAFCIPIEIHFLGVWDTVGSVGAFRRKTLPWIEYNPSVHFLRQALALDENRGNFIPSVWDHERTDPNYQNALEVWFKGGHADVGGGTYLPSPEKDRTIMKLLSRPLLSNITLRWMVRECLENSVVLFDPDSMRRYRSAGILEVRDPKKSYDEQQKVVDNLDAIDITPKPYIALDESPSWKLLEYMPVPKLSQTGNRTHPETAWSPNACAARIVNYNDENSDPIRLHCSVVSFLQTRAAKDDDYIPAATWHGYGQNTWPEIEEGVMSSIISKTDDKLIE
ncbi:hypothetical protein FRC09_015677, partial [Ceratobasidium sp. 395]